MNIQNYIDEINSKEYYNYLEKYKKLIEDNSKCIKSKKCTPKLHIKNNELILDTGKKIKDAVKIPNYIILDNKLEEIDDKMNNLEKQIRLYNNIIHKDINPEIIKVYRNSRDEYFKCESEKEKILNYLDVINKISYRKNKKIEIENKILRITFLKRKEYNQICILKNLKNKNDSKYNEQEYNEKIKKYLDFKELNILKEELIELDNFKLYSDKLYSRKYNNYNISRINYLIETEKIKIKNENKIEKIKIKNENKIEKIKIKNKNKIEKIKMKIKNENKK